MEYVQERVPTLHDFGDAHPPAPTDRATVVVPMTAREHASLAAEGVLEALETVDPGRVLIALRADAEEVGEVAAWLETFDLSLDVLWCTAPAVEATLAEAGLDGPAGKGRDVWLALGVAAANSEFVVVHDADATSYDASQVPRLLFPLANGATFSKGFYARVENDRLYGRLFRLFYVPLVRALRESHDAAVLEYLGAMRYALAGEFAATSALARRLRSPRGWGLEVGTLGDAFEYASFEGSAQVDLGTHEHDHRAVSGPEGLGDMCREVGATLFRVLADHGVEPDFETLPDRYRQAAERLIDGYAMDAGFNDLTYDRAAENTQVETYAGAIQPPTGDDRLPAWVDAPLDPERIAEVATGALEDASD